MQVGGVCLRESTLGIRTAEQLSEGIGVTKMLRDVAAAAGLKTTDTGGFMDLLFRTPRLIRDEDEALYRPAPQFIALVEVGEAEKT